MSLPVLIGFAGVLVAAVATGLLAGRCVRQPRIGFIVWTAATLGLTIALAAQSMGFASGFGPATFRAVQLFALLLAPLWLAWGLVELAVGSDAARFGMRLISAALTVVASVILATDPLTAQPFSKAWPLTGTHFQPVSRDALDVVQVVAVVVAVVTAGLAAVRAAEPGRRIGPPARASLVETGADGGRPGRPGRPHDRRAALPAPGQGGVSAAQHGGGGAGVVRSQQGRRAAPAGGRRTAGGERACGMPAGKPGDEYWPDDRAAGDYVPEGQYVTYGQGRAGALARPPGRLPRRARGAARVPDGDRGRRQGPQPRPPERPDRTAGRGRAGPGSPRPTSGPGRNRSRAGVRGRGHRIRPAGQRGRRWPDRRPPRPRGRTAGS